MTRKNTDKACPDPLANPDFKKPGMFESLAFSILGIQRPLECVQVEVTSACMGKCAYCPHTSQREHWRTRHISPEIFARLWPIFRQSSRVHLQGWGEPLLHPRFLDFVSLAKKAGCEVSTTSCGLLMNDELAFKLAQSGLSMIAFSLAGTDEESNISRRNVGFEEVCHNVRLLREIIDKQESDLPIHLAYLLLANQIEALERLPELMQRLGIDCAVVSTLDYLARDSDRNIAFFPEDRDKIEKARKLLLLISKEAEAYGKKIHFALPGNKARPHINGCRENIRKTLYVDAEGNISPCVYLNVPGSDAEEKRRVFGNILKESPLDIWKKDAFASFRNTLISGKPEQVCQHCPKRLEIIGADD